MPLEPAAIENFQTTVWEYYRQSGRRLPWRTPLLAANAKGELDPYAVTVSEIMLQQTQVSRVVPKYLAFMQAFPTADVLAQSSLAAVLALWSGLGYNRRAKFLWQAARIITKEHSGVFPRTQKELTALPGIGRHTAGAILAYAYNEPVVFIETNIRSVYIYHFFAGRDKVTDSELEPFIGQTLPPDHVREWYWALMDYGSYLKTVTANPSRLSRSYSRQSTFHGSRRQLRGQVLRRLLDGPAAKGDILPDLQDARIPAVLDDLVREGLVEIMPDGRLSLPG